MSNLSNVLRAVAARENLQEPTELTPDENLMVAAPDLVAQDDEIAAAASDSFVDDSEGGEAVLDLIEGHDEAQAIVDTVQEAGEDITPEAVVIAQERLHAIFSRLHCPDIRRVSRESFTVAPNPPDTEEVAEATDRPSPFDAATDLVEDATKNLEYIKVAANEGLREFANRIAVNFKNFTRWSSTYAKKTRQVAAKAAATQGVPNGKMYTNRLRIAHFTDKDKNPLATAQEYGRAVAANSAAISSLEPLSKKLSKAFQLFNKPSPSFDFSTLFEAMPEVTVNGNKVLAISGGLGIFGEESFISGVSGVKVTSWAEMKQALGDVEVSNDHFWTVAQLDKDLSLPVMPAKEVARNANELVKLAEELAADYRVLSEFARHGDSASGGDTLAGSLMGLAADAVANKDMVSIRGQVSRLLMGISHAADHAIDLKAKGLNCLLDYYEWSISQHGKAPATEDGQEPAHPNPNEAEGDPAGGPSNI